MRQQLPRFFASTVLAATLSLTASAQEYSNGGACARGRGPATMTPVEAFGVHPPGPDPADCNRCVFCWWKKIFKPYYAPVSPVATSVRWKPWCYFPLLPYYTPYYIGYCPKRCHKPEPPPYGSDGWGKGPMPCEGPEGLARQHKYGPYSSVIQDDTIFWNMGGNGLVPYGTPRPVHLGAPDLVDAIQVTRQGGGPGCPGPDGIPAVAVSDEAGPAVTPPTEKGDEKAGGKGNKARERLPVPESSEENESDAGEQEGLRLPPPEKVDSPK